jgi:hypothetical protein
MARVRASPDVDAIVARIRNHCDRDFDVTLVPVDPEISVFAIEGAGQFAAGGVLVLDELIMSLGPWPLRRPFSRGITRTSPTSW